MRIFMKLAFLFVAMTLHPIMAHAVDIKQVTGKSGVSAWLVVDESLPVIAMEFAFKNGGAVADPVGFEGLGKLMASTMDEGAGDWDSQAFQGQLDALSIRLSFNSSTDDFTGSLYSLNQYRADVVDMLTAALTQPRFDEEPVDRIRRQLIAHANRQLSSPDSIASLHLWQVMYPDHPYHGPINGSADSLAKIDRDLLRQRFNATIAKDNLVVSVVGDIEEAELAAILDQVFGDLPEKNQLAVPSTPTVDFYGQGHIVPFDVDQTSGLFVHPGIGRDEPDFYAGYLLNYILGGGGFASRLTEEIREKRGLVYSVYSYLINMERDAIWYGGFATRNETAGETVDLVRSVWADARDNGISADDLDRAKTYLTGSYGLRFTNSSAIARYLNGIQRHELGLDFINKRNDLINAVQLDDVNRVARERLDPDALAFVLVGQPGDLDGMTKITPE